jgi:3-methyladenine DNA glycosylase AlkD
MPLPRNWIMNSSTQATENSCIRACFTKGVIRRAVAHVRPIGSCAGSNALSGLIQGALGKSEVAALANRDKAAMAKTVREIASTSAAIARQIRAQKDRTAATLHALQRQFSKQLADKSGRDVIKIALCLVELGEPACRFMGCALVFHHPDALENLGPKMIERLGRGIDSWGDVDVFAGYISGPAWRAKRLADNHIHRWARSKDRWWRRAALVSTVPLNRKSLGGTGDTRRTLAVCRLLVNDQDDMVVKALSWALRELVRHDAKSVRRFLSTHKNALAARVVREVNNKLSTGLKNPRCQKARLTGRSTSTASQRK